MKSSFSACLAFTLRFEGGNSDDPADPGGRTRQGVTQRTFAAWLGRWHVAPRDVFTMTVAERNAIYRDGFWAAVGGDGHAAGVDLAVFDFAVNSGPKRALAVLASCRVADGAARVQAICAARLSFLGALRTFGRFGRGWTARVAACEALGVTMAEHARIGLPPTARVAPQVASRLLAESRKATRAGRQHGGAAAVVAGGGALVHPAAAGGIHPSAGALLGLAVVLAATVGLIGWKAWQAGHRVRAYATLAASA